MSNELENMFTSVITHWKDLSGCTHSIGEASKGNVVPTIERVIFNPPYTIIIWEDKIKTIVKTDENDVFGEEVGFAMAVLKRLYGSRSAYLKMIAQADRQPKLEKKVKKAK